MTLKKNDDILLNDCRQALIMLLTGGYDARDAFNCLMVLQQVENRLEELGVVFNRYTKKKEKK